MKNDPQSFHLVADLTWADLYAGQIHKDLRVLTSFVKKTSSSAELTDSAAKLREQLADARRTITELRVLTQPGPDRSKRELRFILRSRP
jgi:hypothetical protein